MKTREFIATKMKNGHFWSGLISVAFILSALIIFLVDQINDQISFPYVISSMLCIYAASLSIFIDVLSLRIRDDKRNAIIGVACILAELIITAFTILTVRKYTVLQNDLAAAYEEWVVLKEITENNLHIYNRYLELSRGMEKFYLQMGIIFMLWWIPPIIMNFIKVRKTSDPDEESQEENPIMNQEE